MSEDKSRAVGLRTHPQGRIVSEHFRAKIKIRHVSDDLLTHPKCQGAWAVTRPMAKALARSLLSNRFGCELVLVKNGGLKSEGLCEIVFS